MRRLRPATPRQCDLIGQALDKLKSARLDLLAAGSPRAARAVARTIKSAEGAQRHAVHRHTEHARVAAAVVSARVTAALNGGGSR